MRSLTRTDEGPLMLYSDPRIVALYDALNPFGPDTGFYLALAESAAHVVDLGCGTGLLACELAKRGYRVTGIDPSREMLKVARHRPDGDRVTWIEGDAGALAFIPPADLLVMTGHVAQIFLDDASLLKTLEAARRAVRRGGRIAFESRNPAARAWETWTQKRLVDGVEVWNGESSEQDGCVTFTTHYRFASGEEVSVRSELRFRTQDELAYVLTQAGFAQIEWFGDWNRAPVEDTSRELIAVAR
jgi:SAM-dependent methyltransferase